MLVGTLSVCNHKGLISISVPWSYVTVPDQAEKLTWHALQPTLSCYQEQVPCVALCPAWHDYTAGLLHACLLGLCMGHRPELSRQLASDLLYGISHGLSK